MKKSVKKQIVQRGPGRLTANEAAGLEDRLLDAAQHVFVTEGFANATMDAIATAAGASRKTIYARYDNKEDMLRAVFLRLLDESKARGVASAGERGAEPRAILIRLAREIGDTTVSPLVTGLIRLILSEVHQFPDLAPLTVQMQGVAVEDVHETLSRLKADGLLPGLGDVALGTQLFIELAIALRRRHALLGLTLSRREVDRIVETAVNLFLDGCAHQRPSTNRKTPR